MLDKMREHSRSAVIYVFFAIIIAVFVFSFGPASGGGCRGGALSATSLNAAEVNGEAIPLRTFEQTYANVFRDYQQRAGGSFNEELARSLNLRGTVLDQLIDRELLAQAAASQGISVSDKELAEAIRKIPAFQSGGKFDQKTYQLMVERQIGTTPQLFEEDLRRSMMAQKLIASVSASTKVSEDEVRAAFIKEKDKVNLAFVRFSPQQFQAQVTPPTDAELETFISANASKIEDYYKNNSFKFHKPKRVKARHILVKVDESASDADKEKARKQIEDLKAKVNAPGADFAALAKEFSEDPGSKEKGGDLGVFGPGVMDPKFQEGAFALEPGQISDVVQSRFGYHLIKVEEVFAAEDKTLDQAKPEIAKELWAEEKARELAKQKAEEALAAVKTGKPLAEQFPPAASDAQQNPLQAALGAAGAPQTQETGLFAPSGEYVPQIGVAPEVARTAFALTDEKPAPDQVFEVNGNYYVISLKQHERPDMAELEKNMDEWREKARSAKVNTNVDAYVKALKEKANIKKNEKVVGTEPGAFPISLEG